MGVRIGRLKHRVAVQEATEARDAHGGVTKTWRTIATRWASIEPLSGREQILADQMESRITHKVSLRYFPGLTSHHRLSHAGRTFYVVSAVNILELNERTEVMCEERVDTP